jgi:hypothetical protein
MLPPPMNVAVSSITFRGGRPSGAMPTRKLESAAGVIKSALRVGTSATRNATAIVIVGGEARAIRNDRMPSRIRLRRLVCDSTPMADEGEAGSLCVGKIWDMVVVIPSTTVGAGETCADVGGRVDWPPP